MRLAFLCIATGFILSGCTTLSGTYTLSARDTAGNSLTGNTRFVAEGSGIYTVRNALCMNHPKAIVVIRDIHTGKELKSESPYQCP